jgi:hypothetical protein
LFASAEKLAGAVMVGSSLSVTSTVNEQLAVPQPFVAVAVTVVAPTLKVEPEAAEYETVGVVPVVEAPV